MKIKVTNIRALVLTIFILTTSGYPLSTIPGSPFYYLLTLPIVTFILLAHQKKCLINFKSFDIYNFAFTFFIIITIFSFIANWNLPNFSTNIRFLLVITFAFLFTLNVNFFSFVKYYIRVMKIVVIISLIGHFIFNYTSLSLNFPTFTNVNDVTYYNGIIFFVIKGFGFWNNSGMHRNIGCFWEPGLFATFILIALIFSLLIQKEKSVFNNIVFLIGLLSTKSTFAYLMLLPLGILFFTKNLREIKTILIYLISLILLIFLIINMDQIIRSLYAISPQIFGKIALETISFKERIEAPLTNLFIFKNYPILGAGIGNTENIFNSLTTAAQTSTTTYFLAAFGVWGVFHLLFISYGILNYKGISKYSRFIILTILLIQFNKEPHIYFSVSYIILFYFLKQSVIAKNNRIETL